MQKRTLPALFAAAFLFIFIIFGCTKIDTTDLGRDLITVDNVNTFADTLSVNASQFIFNDSTIIDKRAEHVIGNITTDPLFGSTSAAIYLQLKPQFYPYYFGNPGDTVKNSLSSFAGADSLVLCLSYNGSWGDSTAAAIPQKFEVRKIADIDFANKTDTIRKTDYRPATDVELLGSAFITPLRAASKTYLAGKRDSVERQIRIPLNGPGGAAFKNLLYEMQDTATFSLNNGFRNDSLFRSKFNGFAVTVSGAGNTLFYVNLADIKTRLEVFYHTTNNGRRDTVFSFFPMYTQPFGNIRSSSSANYIKRDYTGTSVANPGTDNLYLQSSPGTFANISVPALTGYSNRIVHRAFLIIEQTPNSPATDDVFTAPPFLYLDLKDTVITVPQRYKPLYFDLSNSIQYNPDATDANTPYHPFPFTNVDISNFGGRALQRTDASGIKFTRYEINMTRYVQHIVSNGYRNYEFRIYAPFNYYYSQYAGTKYIIPFYNRLAEGRVRVGSGSNPTHRMKMVVIYSKI